ncbi:hypothetical protein GC170_07865 [bacterium]|nr:hypothetical protein [bacterium]
MPFLQCTRVFVRTLALGWVFFDTFLDDDPWGIYAGRVASIPEYVNEGIYREDDLDDLPTGKIDKVEVCVTDRGNIDRIMLSVKGWRIWLVAAEAYEQMDGSLKLMDWDEQLFLFTDEEALSSIRWENAFGEPTTHHASDVHKGDPSNANRARTPLGNFLDAFFRRWFE